MAQSGGAQASPLRVATGGDPSWRLETGRRRSPACRRTGWLGLTTAGNRSTNSSAAIQCLDSVVVALCDPRWNPRILLGRPKKEALLKDLAARLVRMGWFVAGSEGLEGTINVLRQARDDQLKGLIAPSDRKVASAPRCRA